MLHKATQSFSLIVMPAVVGGLAVSSAAMSLISRVNCTLPPPMATIGPLTAAMSKKQGVLELNWTVTARSPIGV